MNTETANAAEIDLRDRDAVAAVLRTVPRRFVVGFAARCARRVQPELLTARNWDDGVVLYYLADGFISIAEGYAAGLIRRVRSGDLLWERHRFLDYYAEADPAEAAAAYAYAAAAYAEAAAAAAESATYAYVEADAEAAAEAAAAIGDRAGMSVGDDLKAVSGLSRNDREDFFSDRAMPDDFFGPLWPDGMPEEYRAALAKLHPQKAPAVEAEPDNFVVDLDDAGKAALADEVWVNQQYNLGTFDEFGGEHIAVVGKKVLGHDRSLLNLRADVTARTGIPANRIVTTLITRRRKPSVSSAPATDTTS